MDSFMATSDPWRGLRKSRLLASLGARDAMLLRGRLTRTHWNAGDTIAFPDTRLAVAYFPETLVACLGVTQAGSEGTLLGIIGNEGMFGWACLLYESRDAAHIGVFAIWLFPGFDATARVQHVRIGPFRVRVKSSEVEER